MLLEQKDLKIAVENLCQKKAEVLYDLVILLLQLDYIHDLKDKMLPKPSVKLNC